MATNSISNAVMLIRNHLLSVSDITAAVSDRIHSQHFYDFDNKTVPMPLIIIDYDGGETNYGMQSQKIFIDLYVYSKTSASQASSIYDDVYANLHAAKLSNDGIPPKGTAYEDKRPDNGYNTAVRAWFSKGRFTVNLAG